MPPFGGIPMGNPKSFTVPACTKMRAATIRSTLRSCGPQPDHLAARVGALMRVSSSPQATIPHVPQYPDAPQLRAAGDRGGDRAAALQYVRKIAGVTRPSQANAAAFDEAVEVVTRATRRLVDALTSAPPKTRGAEQARARERWQRRASRERPTDSRSTPARRRAYETSHHDRGPGDGSVPRFSAPEDRDRPREERPNHRGAASRPSSSWGGDRQRGARRNRSRLYRLPMTPRA